MLNRTSTLTQDKQNRNRTMENVHNTSRIFNRDDDNTDNDEEVENSFYEELSSLLILKDLMREELVHCPSFRAHIWTSVLNTNVCINNINNKRLYI